MAYTALQVAQAYSFPTAVKGAGETIGIIELGGGFKSTDLSTYFSGLGISPAPTVVAVSVDGAQNKPTGSTSGPDTEVMLDIEVAGAIAPGANIVVYFAPNTDAGFLDAINQAVTDTVNKPSVISISWGGPESTWTAQSLQSYNSALQAAAAVGVTVCVACGDNGSTDGVTDGQRPRGLSRLPARTRWLAAEPRSRSQRQLDHQRSGVERSFHNERRDRRRSERARLPLPSWQANANVPPSAIRWIYAAAACPTSPAMPIPIPAIKCGWTARSSRWAEPARSHRCGQGWSLCSISRSARRWGISIRTCTRPLHCDRTFRDITSGNNGDYSPAPDGTPVAAGAVPMGRRS